MATCAMMTDGRLLFKLDSVEEDTIKLHAARENLSVTDAAADLLEFAMSHKSCEICQEEIDAIGVEDIGYSEVALKIDWPLHGPFSTLKEHDRKFVASVLSMSLREALVVVLYRKELKGIRNVMERGDEEDGTGEPDVSQY